VVSAFGPPLLGGITGPVTQFVLAASREVHSSRFSDHQSLRRDTPPLGMGRDSRWRYCARVL